MNKETDTKNKTSGITSFMESLKPIAHPSYKKEERAYLIRQFQYAISDMQQTSQEIDELWSKFDSLNYQLEKTQARFSKRLLRMEDAVKKLEELK
jgi:hypothetical protein|tara:strand:- start:89 stop:373 length:285 start_codon:yes stop_codon:yes gene_type:complete